MTAIFSSPVAAQARAQLQAVVAPALAEASSRQILVLLRQLPPHFRAGASYQSSYGDALSRVARERLGRRIARDNKLVFVGNWPMPLLELDCIIMAVPADASLADATARISRDANVEWAQPVNTFTTQGGEVTYNDPLYAATPAAREWHLAQLHGIATGKGVKVAIIDSQIEVGHPDLAGQVAVSRDFVIGRPARSEQHGTGIAGIIAAKANNDMGIAGVAPQARLMALRACWQPTGTNVSTCDSLSLAKALHYAIERDAQVINLSLTGPPDPLLARLIDVGLARGTVVVAAADGRVPSGGFPASRPGVIAVSDTRSAVVPRGVFSAPGDGIPTTQSGGRWYIVNGSSYSAAHVSGLVALMHQGHGRARACAQTFVTVPGAGRSIDARASLRRTRLPRDRDCAQ